MSKLAIIIDYDQKRSQAFCAALEKRGFHVELADKNIVEIYEGEILSKILRKEEVLLHEGPIYIFVLNAQVLISQLNGRIGTFFNNLLDSFSRELRQNLVISMVSTDNPEQILPDLTEVVQIKETPFFLRLLQSKSLQQTASTLEKESCCGGHSTDKDHECQCPGGCKDKE